jgi:drug/metabolite transporter (DMT)-like permease
VTVTQWVGALISLLGIGLVVSAGSGEGTTLVGDALAVAAMAGWATYTVASRPLLARHSPLAVTGYSLAIGAALYVPLAWKGLAAIEWSAVPQSAWMATVASGLFALFVAYLIWYTAVRELGSAHTAIYSNVTPVVAMAVAAVWLNEPLTLMKVAGAAAVILGVGITRVERRGEEPPSEG